ncbi:MAG: tyrosine-type recombinase/integrase [Bryobacteraceae bacterium]
MNSFAVQRGTRSLSRALAVKRAENTGKWEVAPDADPKASTGIEIRDAVQAFLNHCTAESGSNVADVTVSKYRTAIGRFQEFCDEAGYTRISEVDRSVLIAWKDTWAEWGIGPGTTGNYIMITKVFGGFCLERNWWPRNFASDLKNPTNYQHTERLPYTDDEMEAILEAARTVELDVQQPITNEELETFILMMRHTGMAICDVALLRESEIVGDEVRYFRKKTQRQANRILVVVPLPAWLLDQLKRIKTTNGYYFCPGSPHLISITRRWHNRLSQVFGAAGIEKCESHRFRHTFATKMLMRRIPGVGYIPVSVVARWLGHANEKTTIRYYSHWIAERQERASDLMRAIHREDANGSA